MRLTVKCWAYMLFPGSAHTPSSGPSEGVNALCMACLHPEIVENSAMVGNHRFGTCMKITYVKKTLSAAFYGTVLKIETPTNPARGAPCTWQVGSKGIPPTQRKHVKRGRTLSRGVFQRSNVLSLSESCGLMYGIP